MIQFVGDRDSTTRPMLKEVLAADEKHAEDLVSFIEDIENWSRAVRPAGAWGERAQRRGAPDAG